MTLNYWKMVKRYHDLKEEVGGSIPGCEISSLLDRNLAMSCRLWLIKRKKKRKKHNIYVPTLIYLYIWMKK